MIGIKWNREKTTTLWLRGVGARSYCHQLNSDHSIGCSILNFIFRIKSVRSLSNQEHIVQDITTSGYVYSFHFSKVTICFCFHCSCLSNLITGNIFNNCRLTFERNFTWKWTPWSINWGFMVSSIFLEHV